MQVLQLIREKANICQQIHLPAQSGSSSVLSRMGRGYTREAYVDLVHHIRDIIPGRRMCDLCGWDSIRDMGISGYRVCVSRMVKVHMYNCIVCLTLNSLVPLCCVAHT